MQPCPNNPGERAARWRCAPGGGAWAESRPDLSGCRSAWLVRLRKELLASSSSSTQGWSSLSRAAEGLDQQLGMYPAFGGDLLGAVEIVEMIARRMRCEDFITSQDASVLVS